MNKPILALTILQPWAALIAAEEKRFETRGWSTPYRGRLVIHAGRNREYLTKALDPLSSLHALLVGAFGADLGAPGLFPLGMAVAVVDLVGCIRTEQCSINSTERALGDFSPGRYAWKLENVWRIKEPIPIQGKQGLWAWPENLMDRLP